MLLVLRQLVELKHSRVSRLRGISLYVLIRRRVLAEAGASQGFNDVAF
jgi:hypothetical protein